MNASQCTMHNLPSCIHRHLGNLLPLLQPGGQRPYDRSSMTAVTASLQSCVLLLVLWPVLAVRQLPLAGATAVLPSTSRPATPHQLQLAAHLPSSHLPSNVHGSYHGPNDGQHQDPRHRQLQAAAAPSSPTCPTRPAAVMYAPSNIQPGDFWVIVQFASDVNLTILSGPLCRPSYWCIMGASLPGLIVEGSVQTLGGTLFR